LGFKILLRAEPGDFVTGISSIFEEQPVSLIVPSNLDWFDIRAVENIFKDFLPSIFVNYSLGKSGDNELKCLQNIVKLTGQRDIPVIHFSSYRVFGKTVSENKLHEEIQPKPRDELGKQLSSLEKAVRRCEKHLVLRLSWMLGGECDSLLDILIPKLVSGDTVFVSDHDYGRPINIASTCDMVLAMVQQILCGAENWGIFHVRSSDKCSEAELCDSLVRLMRSHIDREIEMPLVAGVDDDRRLLRGNALLSGRRCTDNFGIQLQPWRRGLKSAVKKYLSDRGYLGDQHMKHPRYDPTD